MLSIEIGLQSRIEISYGSNRGSKSAVFFIVAFLAVEMMTSKGIEMAAGLS